MAGAESDVLLRYYVDELEDAVPPGSSAPLTLMVGGFLVFGTPITTAQFERLSVEHYPQDSAWRKIVEGSATQTEEGARRYDEKRRKLVEEFKAFPEGEEPSAELRERSEKLKRIYINLRDVRILAPDSSLMQIRCWRGRLSEVAGWNFGELGIGADRTASGGL